MVGKLLANHNAVAMSHDLLAGLELPVNWVSDL